MSPIRERKRDLCRSADLSRDDLNAIFERAADLKSRLQRGIVHPRLAHKSLAMIFEKPSLRTRATFELGMLQLGGHAIVFGQEIGLGGRESIHDVARNLERWFDLIMARTFAQATVDELARHARVPVINALSDDEHPCQALADCLTLIEHLDAKKGPDALAGFRLTYIGDGNNICHSLMITGARLGMHVTVCTPRGYEPDGAIARQAEADAKAHGGACTHTYEPRAAVAEAGAIYTDVWASMGQESEAATRAGLFRPYQVNAELLAAAPEGVWVMHDLPAHRGEEITDEAIDGPGSLVFDQAENRLHAQKGLMVWLMEQCG